MLSRVIDKPEMSTAVHKSSGTKLIDMNEQQFLFFIRKDLGCVEETCFITHFIITNKCCHWPAAVVRIELKSNKHFCFTSKRLNITLICGIILESEGLSEQS
jgi:hypothetical protein